MEAFGRRLPQELPDNRAACTGHRVMVATGKAQTIGATQKVITMPARVAAPAAMLAVAA